MPRSKSAKKRLRQGERRGLRNQSRKSRTKTAVKRFERALASGEVEAAEAALRAASSEIDRAARRNVFHPNSAARKKSRMARLLAGARGSGPAPSP